MAASAILGFIFIDGSFAMRPGAMGEAPAFAQH